MKNNTETIYKGKIFELKKESVNLPNGNRATMDIIKHPGAAAMVPVLENGRVILLRQYRHAAGGYIWEIPAGTLENEEAPEECAARELIEETGFRPEELTLLTSITPVPGYSTERIFIFLARDLTLEKQNLDPDEILELHDFSMEKAISMIREGLIQDAKTIVGILLAAPLLFTKKT